jgi:hypothetical protein
VTVAPQAKHLFLVVEWALVNSNSQRPLKFHDHGYTAHYLLPPSATRQMYPRPHSCRYTCPSIEHEGAIWTPYTRERSLDQRFVCSLHQCRDHIESSRSDRVRLNLICARRLGQFIVAAWQCAQVWARQAANFKVDNCPAPSFPTRFRPEGPFLGLSAGLREYHDREALICWLDECYLTVLDWHAYSRMLAFKIIDLMATHRGATLPYYSVDEHMLGVVYMDKISDPEHRQELVRHGVPIFDIITRTPFFSRQYPPLPEFAGEVQQDLIHEILQNPDHSLEVVWWEHGFFPSFPTQSMGGGTPRFY